MARISKATLAERLKQQIADAILAGELPPGTKLDEATLAARFEVSRTPVRDALKLLVVTGLVDIKPHRGAEVRQLSNPELDEAFEAMAEMEAVCARLAAMRMTGRERQALEAIHNRAGEAMHVGSRETYDQINLEFHSAIYQGAHNHVMAETARALRTRIQPFRRAQFRIVGRLKKSWDEHDQVVRAILRGDGTEAQRAMLHHVLVVSDASHEVVAAVPTLHTMGD